MNDIETTHVTLTVHNDTCATHVATTSDHGNVTSLERNEIGDLVLLDVEFNGIVNLDGWVGVTNSPAIVGGNVWNTAAAQSDTSNLEELVRSLLRSNAVDGKSAFDIVQDAEVFTRLLERNDIYIIL